MKSISFLSLAGLPLASAAAVASLVSRDSNISISYAEAYLNISLPISDYGCAAAPAGSLLTKYSKFVDVLADYYSVIATPWAAQDKNACGQCVALTYTNEEGEKRKVYAVTVDATGGYFNVDKAGFAGLGGYGSFAAGTLSGEAETVDIKKCKRARQ